ncbi:hypothetical protein ACLOAV_007791 [Pseudogymnoascus australis]
MPSQPAAGMCIRTAILVYDGLVWSQSWCLPFPRKIAKYAYKRAMECNVRLSRQKPCNGHPPAIEPATLLIYHLRQSLGLLPEHRGHCFSARVPLQLASSQSGTHMSWSYVTLRLDAETVTHPSLAEANASCVEPIMLLRRTA